MQYNILCEEYEDPNIYPHISKEVLSHNQRYPKILQEILFYSPDLICMQELSQNYNVINLELAKHGYTKVFKKKTNEKQDGCAIFYKTKVFELVEKFFIEFKSSSIKLLNRDHVGLAVALKFRNKVLIVATTHLLLNLKRGEIQLGQLVAFVQALEKIKQKFQACEVIVAGDFNFIPCSALYKFLTQREFDFRGITRFMLSNRREADLLNNNRPWSARHMTSFWKQKPTDEF